MLFTLTDRQLTLFITKNDAGVYNVCPGTENLNCALGISPLKFDLGDHTGPYGGIKMGRENCP
jgi:hypothetical protein